MTDTISRAAAIDAICKEWCYVTYDNCPHVYDGFMCDGCDDVKALELLPSDEPHNKDAISREGLLKSWEELSPRGRTEFDQVIMTIPALPSTDADKPKVIGIDYSPYRIQTTAPSVDSYTRSIGLMPDAVMTDIQTEERARFVAKETELAYIEAKLENAEKRLQGACVANFIAEQLERLKDMTDEERLKLLQMMFPSVDAKQGGDAKMRNDRTYINEPYMQQSRHDDGIMTREEAIELLEDLDGAIEDNQGRDYDEAFRMAIKALSAEADCSTCKYKDSDWYSVECDSCCGNNNHYVSADAVQGEWVEEDEYGDLWVCDQCGFANEYKFNFCPNCGARMKGGAE